MITVYSPTAQDWSNNGLCVLLPTECIIKESAGGTYELEITHLIDNDLRWQMIQRGCLIKAPVPARETPLITNFYEGSAGTPGHVIYKTNITTGSAGGYVRIYTKANTNSKVLQKLKNGIEFIYHGDAGTNWIKGTSAEGVTGYLYKANVAYVRTEPDVPGSPAYNTVVPPRQVREQLFRVYAVEIDDKANTVSAKARHISYDLIGNVVKTYNPSTKAPQAALNEMSADLVNSNDFNFYTNISGTITAEWARRNAIEVLIDPDVGIVQTQKAQLVRDNYDIFVLQNTEINRGVTISYGKNLLGVKSNVNDEAAITRLIPVGKDANGNPMYLPEVYVDSQHINEYPTVRAIPFDVQDAAVTAEMTTEQAYTKMREACAAEFAAGCDLIDIDIDVDFIHLGDTEEYKQYKNLEQVFLYDTVTVKHGKLGLLYKTQVIGYTFDAVLGRYKGITLGNIKNGAELGSVAGFQLPNSGISGQKLMPGSVGSGALRDLSVVTAKIGYGAITIAKIEEATIKLLNAESIIAAVAEINKVIAGTVTTNDLYAAVVSAVTAEIGTVTSGEVTTKALYAEIIKAVVLEIGKVTAGTISTNELYAQIVTAAAADIDRVTAGTVQTGELYAAVVAAVKAEIGKVTAGTIATNELFAVLAEMVRMTAKTADIDFGKIKDLVSDTAIIQKGVNGKLYVADLAVTEGNMVSLTVGELIVKGVDGSFYSVSVDEAGAITTTKKEISGGDVEDASLPGGKLLEGSVTVREFNAENIFGSEAILGELTAGLAKFGTLFANVGILGQLETALIKSEYLKLLADEISLKADKVSLEALQSIFYVDEAGAHLRQEGQKNGIDMGGGGVAIVDGAGKQVAIMAEGESMFPVLRVGSKMLTGGFQTSILPDGGVIEQWI